MCRGGISTSGIWCDVEGNGNIVELTAVVSSGEQAFVTVVDCSCNAFTCLAGFTPVMYGA